MIAGLLVNIDVEHLDKAAEFYCAALGLRVGRRFDGWLELTGAPAPLYLLPKKSGSAVSPASPKTRDYGRHWTPVHLDFVVTDLETALRQAKAAGATLESGIETHAYGRIVLMADPFGNGFCLLQFSGRGYDEIAR